MTREQLEHLIRAAAVLADDDAIVVIGSQAILGQFPDAPASMRVSVEADLFPLHHPERAETIEGSIGELSPFHETFGYYPGWKERLIVVQNERTRGAKGLCLEVHDLLVAKAIAGREKDLSFLRDAVRHRMAKPEILFRRLATMRLEEAVREAARATIERVFRTAIHS
jgi:hypothetical protein